MYKVGRELACFSLVSHLFLMDQYWVIASYIFYLTFLTFWHLRISNKSAMANANVIDFAVSQFCPTVSVQLQYVSN